MISIERMIEAIQEAEAYFATLGYLPDPDEVAQEVMISLGDEAEVINEQDLLELILKTELERDLAIQETEADHGPTV